MAGEKLAQAALALHRFGLGPRQGTIAAIASDPAGAMLAELEHPGAAKLNDAQLLSGGDAARAVFAAQEQRQLERAMAAKPGDGGRAMEIGQPAPGMNNSSREASEKRAIKPQPPNVAQELYLTEAKARIDAALAADVGFVERLVWFWSNHFCVAADKGAVVRGLCGPYEREAIRPHVLGKLADMLVAAESHPAMLLYLDNARSIGPNSIAGLNQHRGLNENLAREILELHTLGVRSVYTQSDVTNFAKVITGWTIVGFKQDPRRAGEFAFNARLHEPGPQTVIGKSYAQAGFDQGRAVLFDLAQHPASAKHIAGKFARYFVADQPAASLVDRLARQLLTTGGDLKALAQALITAPEAWTAARSKLKRPSEWIAAALRATGVTSPDIRQIIAAHNLLGEPLWRPPAPNGFAAESAAWLEGLSERLDVASQMAARLGNLLDPQALCENALGPLASEQTRQAIARAESRPQGVALLLLAPEFQRS